MEYNCSYVYDNSFVKGLGTINDLSRLKHHGGRTHSVLLQGVMCLTHLAITKIFVLEPNVHSREVIYSNQKV